MSDELDDEHFRQSRVGNIRMCKLQRKITVQEAEAKHLVKDFGLNGDTSEGAERLRAARRELARERGIPDTGEPIPFGFANIRWREMIGQMRAGDELWEFGSPDHAWKHLAGRAGIALVRNGEVYDCIVTFMN
jgi:hypothetical protein